MPTNSDTLIEIIQDLLQGGGQPKLGERILENTKVKQALTALTEREERIKLQSKKEQLDEIIELQTIQFNRWTQTDIANFFNGVGRIYRKLESELTKQPQGKK